MIDQIRNNLNYNLTRVENLMSVYESHPDVQGQGRKSAEVLDILRAAFVLLHASLEAALRDIAYWKLPSANQTVLDDIPLAGHGRSPKKFPLGDLAVFRGKTIEEIFATSVDEYLEKSNFNNTDEIAKLMTSIGIETAKINARFSDLQALMQRRHQIVHRADWQDEVTGSGDHIIRAINKYMVRGWAHAVQEFAEAVFSQI